jgi:hypothetical protein
MLCVHLGQLIATLLDDSTTFEPATSFGGALLSLAWLIRFHARINRDFYQKYAGCEIFNPRSGSTSGLAA